MTEILIIDDDIELCDLLVDYLSPEGFAVETVNDGELGLARALKGSFDLVILDVMLPGMNGFDILSRLRASSQVPVLMLTARGDEVDRIVGLEMGADDYLPKPFNPRELVARIRAVGRRAETPQKEEISHTRVAERLVLDDVILDTGKRQIWRGDEKIAVTGVEFSLLYELLKEAGQVVTRDYLAEKVLGRKLALFDRSIDVHISSLRKKLGNQPDGSERISTVRGSGYLYLQPSATDE